MTTTLQYATLARVTDALQVMLIRASVVIGALVRSARSDARRSLCWLVAA